MILVLGKHYNSSVQQSTSPSRNSLHDNKQVLFHKTLGLQEPAELFQDLANIEMVAMLNEGFCELHHKLYCPPSEELSRECGKVRLSNCAIRPVPVPVFPSAVAVWSALSCSTCAHASCIALFCLFYRFILLVFSLYFDSRFSFPVV